MGDVFARPWRSFRQSRFYRLVDVWRTEAMDGVAPMVARTPTVGRFSADGKRLLIGMSGSWEKHELVKLFSIDGTEIGGFPTRPGEEGVFDVAFSPDERFVTAVLFNKFARFTVEGERVAEFPLKHDGVASRISADGRIGIASHPHDAEPSIELVDLETMRPIARVDAPKLHHGIALAHDARAVFTTAGNAVHAIPFDPAGPRWTSPTNGGTRSIWMSEDGAFVVACHSPLSPRGEEVVVHRVEDGDVVARFPFAGVDRARLLRDGRLLAWPQGGGAGFIYDLARNEPEGRQAAWVASVLCVSPDGRTLARTSFQWEIAQLFDTHDGTRRVGPPRHAPAALAASPDGALVAAWTAERDLAFLDARTGERADVPTGGQPPAWVQALRDPNTVVRPDGATVVMDGSTVTRGMPADPPASREVIFTMPPHVTLRYCSLSLSPSGRRALVGTGLGDHHVIDVEAGGSVVHLPARSDSQRWGSFARMIDDECAVFVLPGTKLVALHLANESPRWEVQAPVHRVVVDAGRARLLAVAEDLVRVLSIASGEELDRLELHSSGDTIASAALGPQGRLYLGGSLGRIYVFDPALS